MATVQETATQIASIIARLDAGTITEAQAATELNVALADFPPVASIQDLTAKVIAMIGRMDGTLIVSGVPSPSVGTIGSIAIDLTNKQLYGPKTVTGWGSPTPLVGAQGNTGPAGTITDITVATGAAGSNASIVVGGTPSARTMALTVPRGNKGDTGPSPVLSIASVTTGAPGSDANITQGGTALAPTYAFVIPRGATGDKGDTGAVPNVTAQIAMIAHGGVASVTRSGPDTAPVLTFNIPAPLDGVDAKQVEFNKSATHIQWRRIGEAAWLDLVALSDLMVKGDKGDAFEFDAKPANLAARAVYDAEPEGFTVLVMDTGMVYARIGATAGVWSDGFPFGQTQNAILEALSQLNATEGVLVQTGPDTFAKRAIGVGTGASLPDRDAADSRYRQIGAAVPLADITGLVAALDEKADAGAVLAALSGKQAALGFTPEDASKKGVANGYAGLGADGKVPAGQLPAPPTVPVKSNGAGLREATNDTDFLTPKSVADAAALVALTDAATVAVNMEAGTNFTLTLAGNRTLGAPTNTKPGMSGTILIKQDATGSRTLSYASAWMPIGSTPALSTAANSVDLLTWIVETSSKISFTLTKGRAA